MISITYYSRDWKSELTKFADKLENGAGCFCFTDASGERISENWEYFISAEPVEDKSCMFTG